MATVIELLVNHRTEEGNTLARIRGDRNAPTVTIPASMLPEALPKDSLISLELGKLVYSDSGRYLKPVDCKILGTKASEKHELAGQVYGAAGAPHPADAADADAPF